MHELVTRVFVVADNGNAVETRYFSLEVNESGVGNSREKLTERRQIAI